MPQAKMEPERREHLEIALRVLSAMAAYREPEPADTTLLLQIAECDEERTMPLDELACNVVFRELRQT